MLKVFSGTQGTAIFTKNSHGYLVHEWSSNVDKETFSYRVAAKDVCGKPALICEEGMIHIYFISASKELRHVQINQTQPKEAVESVVAEKVNGSISPACVTYGKNVYVYYVDEERRLAEAKNGLLTWKENACKRLVDEKKGDRSMLVTYKTEKGKAYLFYQRMGNVYWISLENQEKQSDLNFFQIPFAINNKHRFRVTEILGKFCFFFVSQDNYIYQVAMDRNLEALQLVKKLGEVKVDALNPLSVISDQNDISIWFASGQQELSCYSRSFEAEHWKEQSFKIEPIIGSYLTLSKINNKIWLFFLDQNQILAKYTMNQEGQSLQLSKYDRLPHLIWEKEKAQCKVVGRGYWTQCFAHSQLGIAVKKFRTTDHANMVEKQIQNQIHLEKIEPNMVGHRLYEKGILMGFSLPLLKGKSWGQMLKNKDSLVNKSPMTRVKLLISLAEHIRAIQQIGLCHGDIHMGNIIMNVDEKSTVLEPKAWSKVIDFGNAFGMVEGQRTSANGLTGAMNLIPKEVHDAKWQNYDPFGINAYQLAVIGLMFLLRENFTCQFKAEKKVQQLRKNKEYPEQIVLWFEELIHEDVKRRNIALNQDVKIFLDLTRDIYVSKKELSQGSSTASDSCIVLKEAHTNGLKTLKTDKKVESQKKAEPEKKEQKKKMITSPSNSCKTTKILNKLEKVEQSRKRPPMKF